MSNTTYRRVGEPRVAGMACLLSVVTACASHPTPVASPAQAQAQVLPAATSSTDAPPAVSAPATASEDASKGTPQGASEATRAAHAALLEAYPFKDTRDFEDARHGLIAPLPNAGEIKDAEGKVVWSLKPFLDYIRQGERAPETVNPSLWRQAQLLMFNGLFEVVAGVYQVRGADLSNMTIVEGTRGITIYDPLISAETAKAALELYYAHRPKRPVVAVVYSHSHVDHFGGVRGVVDEADVKAGKVKIYAPAGFIENAISENVYAGTAMGRRASYMYGNLLPVSAQGQNTAGLGITTSSGQLTLIAPTDLITQPEEVRTIDGIRYEFLNAPGSEAPSEMMWYLPKYKVLNTAEDSTHTMHNLYTLRGAKTRDAAKWPEYLNRAIRKWGDVAEVELGMHHWPTRGTQAVVAHVKGQRDIYKFLHDQTLHFANQGYTINELAPKVALPDDLVAQWSTHGYYGSQSHNVRAVYNFYLGYFDGNPANLDPLPPSELAHRYVAVLGGPAAVLILGKKALAEGQYRWGAELMKHLVFAHPEHQDAKNVLADLLEQMGYQAESGPWRNFYLSGAKELREGIAKAATPSTSSPDILANMPLDLIFGYMGIQLDAQKAGGKKLALNFVLPDVKQKYALFLEHSVLNHWSDFQAKDADATITLDRAVLNQILGKQLSLQDAVAQGKLKVTGDASKFSELLVMLVDLNQSFWFGIVTP
ncbi:MAG: alkyl sulfatase dimerization domain-containing protein [Myxococcales bacterium]